MKKIELMLVMTLCLFAFACQGPEEEDALTKAAAIHDQVLTVDTHVDTPYMLLEPGYDISKVNDINQGGGQVDFPRMQQGGLDAVFFAVYMSQGERTTEDFQAAVDNAEERFKLLHDTIAQHSDLVELALTADDAFRIEKTGKRIMFLSIENGYPMGIDIGLVKTYFDHGVRLSGLCHSGTNEICDSATDKPEHNGLSETGEKVVSEMNRLGIVIDVSHISDQAFYDVLDVTQVPIVASHSSARAVCDVVRNMTDDMLKKLAENGGVIQLCLLSSYIKKVAQDPNRDEAVKKLYEKYPNWTTSDEEQELFRKEMAEIDQKYPRKLATVADAVDHIDHIIKVAGIDHVGIGSDFDGGGGLADCMDASQLGNVTIELVKRGYTEEQIRKIWGGNLMRIMRQAQVFAE